MISRKKAEKVGTEKGVRGEKVRQSFYSVIHVFIIRLLARDKLL
jgi:hypothetical protein